MSRVTTVLPTRVAVAAFMALVLVLLPVAASVEPVDAAAVTCTNDEWKELGWACGAIVRKNDVVTLMVGKEKCEGKARTDQVTGGFPVVTSVALDFAVACKGFGDVKAKIIYIKDANAMLDPEGLPDDRALCNGIDDDGDTLIDEGCSVGGTTELLVGGADASAGPADSAGSSIPYAAIGGGMAVAVVTLAAGGWYARRRWLQ